MNALDELVVQKRLSCEDECSYKLRLKRYTEQRKNLGELNRLARSKPRPVVIVEEETETVKEEVESDASASTNTAFPSEDASDEVTSVTSVLGKRVGEYTDEDATQYQSKVRKINPNEMDDFFWAPPFVEIMYPDAAELSMKAWDKMKRDAAKSMGVDDMDVEEALDAFRDRKTIFEDDTDELINWMENEINQMEMGQHDETMEDFTDAYFETQRLNVGELEELRA